MIWKDVPGYEGLYTASDTGLIKNKQGKILCPGKNQKKRMYFRMRLWRNKKGTRYMVHRIIALTFLGEPAALQEINHKDGDGGNNKINNLEWVSHKENSLHATRILKRGIEENHRSAKLKTSQVIEIKKLLLENISLYKIAKVFSVSYSTILAIKNQRSWRNVTLKSEI